MQEKNKKCTGSRGLVDEEFDDEDKFEGGETESDDGDGFVDMI